jgi:hypothetical protein
MGPIVASVIGFAAGVAIGASALFLKLHPQRAGGQTELAALRAKLAETETAQHEVAVLRAQASALRHDLRGILSPALLSADRLANSQDPASRKAADIVIRSVERATARLADKSQPQETSKSVLE